MQSARTASIETPSGKGAADENFPVGSRLLPARLRPHVAAYYSFARAIDDIADNPDLASADKIARLTRFEDAIVGRETADPALARAHRMRASLDETGITARHCTDLIDAFKQDAVKTRYEDWSELIFYCERSANPVGRYLLDLHGEAVAGYVCSDALCSALQIINHLQDMQADYRGLDRVYVPLAFLRAEGLGVEVLDGRSSPPGLRHVIDRCLDGVDALLITAKPLPTTLASLSLGLESGAIWHLAVRLAHMLRHGDPLAARVALGRSGLTLHAGLGAAGTLLARALSFRRAMPRQPGHC